MLGRTECVFCVQLLWLLLQTCVIDRPFSVSASNVAFADHGCHHIGFSMLPYVPLVSCSALDCTPKLALKSSILNQEGYGHQSHSIPPHYPLPEQPDASLRPHTLLLGHNTVAMLLTSYSHSNPPGCDNPHPQLQGVS